MHKQRFLETLERELPCFPVIAQSLTMELYRYADIVDLWHIRHRIESVINQNFAHPLACLYKSIDPDCIDRDPTNAEVANVIVEEGRIRDMWEQSISTVSKILNPKFEEGENANHFF